MGLSKANEMLLLGKKVDAKTAMDWNICSQVVPSRGNDATSDPFADDSLASYMCQELEKRLLSLPLSDATAQVFVSLIRGPRRARLQQVCRDEFLRLDQRFQSGEVQEAAQKVLFGKKAKSSNTQRSKL
jgi:enoyl-CoA hydratase/carnithine racemase